MVGGKRNLQTDNRGAELRSQALDGGGLTLVVQYIRVDGEDAELDTNDGPGVTDVSSTGEEQEELISQSDLPFCSNQKPHVPKHV